MAEILRVEDLTKYFATKKGTLHAVDGVTFGLREGQTLGIVGESGCGKSTLGRVILHLHQRTGGRIIFQGKDISDVTKAQLKELRKDMQTELKNKDWFQTLPDFSAYVVRKGQALADYAANPLDWSRRCLINIAKAGLFSSDRTIAEYDRDIWHLGK